MAESVHDNALFPGGKASARITLALFVMVTLFFVAITFSPWRSGFADAANRGPGDVELYRAEVDRIHGGESYYDAAAAELHERGYPTRSVFNWRTPLPVGLIGLLPDVSWAKAILGLLALTLIWLSFGLLVDEGGMQQGMLGVVLLSGALLPCILGDLVVMSELWSGVLIAISAVCYGLKRSQAGILVGIAALFFRELAAPYCLLCMALAAHDRRYRELLVWCLGLAVYAAFFGLHVWAVLPRITLDGTAHADGWIRFGAAGFLISTVQMNAYLLLLPQWITAIYLSCTLLGCAAWKLPSGRLVGLTIVTYSIAFSIAGHDFNQYWGSLMAPLFCLGAAHFPQAMRQLWTAAALPVPKRARLISVQN